MQLIVCHFLISFRFKPLTGAHLINGRARAPRAPHLNQTSRISRICHCLPSARSENAPYQSIYEMASSVRRESGGIHPPIRHSKLKHSPDKNSVFHIGQAPAEGHHPARRFPPSESCLLHFGLCCSASSSSRNRGHAAPGPSPGGAPDNSP